MKQEQISTAYKTVEELYKVKGLPFAVSKQLYMLKHDLEPHAQCENEKRVEVLETWKAINPDGTLHITTENVNQINKAFDEIAKTEIEWLAEPVKMTLTAEQVEKLGITGEIIEKLVGFIEFTEEGDE